MSFKVLIPQQIDEDGEKYLLERGYEIKACDTSIDALKKEVEDCDAILARTVSLPAEVITAGKRLKVIARHGVGVDNIDMKTATDMGIFVTNAPYCNEKTVAEHALGLIINLAKNMLYCDKELRQGNYSIRDQITNIDLDQKILGIIGLGKIGSLLSKKAALGLNMKVLGYHPSSPKEALGEEIELTNDWDYLFTNADFVSLHLPVTKNTRNIVGKKEFSMMKPTSYIVNTARGELIDEPALIDALKNGDICGAALDVYAQEPPSKDNPLFSLNNVVLSPHNASHTVEAKKRMALCAAKCIDEVLSGQKPSWPCNQPHCS